MRSERNPQFMRGQKMPVTISMDPDQVHALDRIADQKRTSRAQLIRESVDLLLAREEAREAA